MCNICRESMDLNIRYILWISTYRVVHGSKCKIIRDSQIWVLLNRSEQVITRYLTTIGRSPALAK